MKHCLLSRKTERGREGLRHLKCVFVVALLIALFGSLPVAGAPEDLVVYRVPLRGEISGGMVRFIKRAFREAETRGADAILLEIGTLGGFVASAIDIKDDILDSPIPVFAHVKGRAWSAGALVAMACDGVAMAPGSSIGAAEPRPLDEKTLSAWRAELETTAERRGRDPQVAAAMADASVAIPGLVEEGELLTLAAKRAVEIGFVEGTAERTMEALALFGLEGASIVDVRPTSAERLAQFVTNPTLAPILLTVGFLGLIVEVFTAGWGVAGTVGLVALFLYFGGAFLGGVPGAWVLLLFIGGVILLFVEAVVPGFGVFGLGGIIAMILSIYLASATDPQALRSLIIAVAATVILAVILAKQAARKGFLLRLSLPNTERDFFSTSERRDLVGKEGVAITPLRPSGMADIDGERINVVTEGGFLDVGVPLSVTKVEGGRVIVKPIQQKSGGQ